MYELVINADDFGLTAGINDAIAECYRGGLVRSATLMATAAGFEHAVQIAHANPDLDVGCHLVLVDGTPLSAREQISSLIHRGTNSFPNQLKDVVLREILGNLREEEIERECVAQIQRIQSYDVEVTHVDTHKHTHWLPSVFRGVMRAARTCGVQIIRNPFPAKPMTVASLVSCPQSMKRFLKETLLASFEREFKCQVDQLGMLTTAGVLGVFEKPFTSVEDIATYFSGLPFGLVEMVCHPGHLDSALAGIDTRLKTTRELQLNTLTSNAFRLFVEEHEIQLRSFKSACHPSSQRVSSKSVASKQSLLPRG
jgi:predicted glycoside hydrolase/deacetylase ChbG (UPF0249 family)